MNNILEQAHRFVKKRVATSQWFRSVDGALNTIAEYKTMNIIRKGKFGGCRRATLLARFGSSNVHWASLSSIQCSIRSRHAFKLTFATQRAPLRRESPVGESPTPGVLGMPG
jgi:hypothetical protein